MNDIFKNGDEVFIIFNDGSREMGTIHSVVEQGIVLFGDANIIFHPYSAIFLIQKEKNKNE